MATVKVEKKFNLCLFLSLDEAEYLRGMTQNPPNDDEEDHFNKALRAEIFTALANGLREA